MMYGKANANKYDAHKQRCSAGVNVRFGQDMLDQYGRIVLTNMHEPTLYVNIYIYTYTHNTKQLQHNFAHVSHRQIPDFTDLLHNKAKDEPVDE